MAETNENEAREAAPRYATGELAEACGTTVRTVQYYDGKGLLSPPGYSEGRLLPFRADCRRRFSQAMRKRRPRGVSFAACGVFRGCYQVREAMARNWATVGTWAFRPPSTVTTWPVK